MTANHFFYWRMASASAKAAGAQYLLMKALRQWYDVQLQRELKILLQVWSRRQIIAYNKQSSGRWSPHNLTIRDCARGNSQCESTPASAADQRRNMSSSTSFFLLLAPTISDGGPAPCPTVQADTAPTAWQTSAGADGGVTSGLGAFDGWTPPKPWQQRAFAVELCCL